MIEIQVRLCPIGKPTTDVRRMFERVPCRGESILVGNDRYVVVEIDWAENGRPFVIARQGVKP